MSNKICSEAYLVSRGFILGKSLRATYAGQTQTVRADHLIAELEARSGVLVDNTIPMPSVNTIN